MASAARGDRQDGSGSMGLPFSPWHVFLGWWDLITDIMGIVSTRTLIGQVQKVCKVDFPRYFTAFLVVQLFLLLGNLVTHAAVAAAAARGTVPRAKPAQNRDIWFAALRGLLNMELAYQEFKRHSRPSAQHTAASLQFKMAELVWEAPQVVVSWTIVLLRMLYDAMTTALGEPVHISHWTRVFQVLSAGTGLLSLTIAATDFISIHPLSAWSSTNPPAKLFAGLVDVSGTWLRTLAIGMYAFTNLLSRSFFYMLCMCIFMLYFDKYGESYLWYLIPTMFGGAFIYSLVLMAGFGSWKVVPAAVVSVFINVPWVTGRKLEFRTGRFSSWPSWVLEFCWVFGIAGFAALAGVMRNSPDQIASIMCGIEDRDPLYLQPASLETPSGKTFFVLAMIAPQCTVVVDLVLFVALAGWQSERRRRFIKKHGVQAALMAQTLGIPLDLPALSYKWQGLIAVRQPWEEYTPPVIAPL